MLPGAIPWGCTILAFSDSGVTYSPISTPTVEVPSTAFHPVRNATRVPTTATMLALLPTWVDEVVPALGPFTEEDAETEVVQPRYMQHIPSQNAALLIHRWRVRP
jgi:hypothetical protein